MSVDPLHRECTRLINTGESQRVVREVHLRLFGEGHVSPHVYESKLLLIKATKTTFLDSMHCCFCIGFCDEEIA